MDGGSRTDRHAVAAPAGPRTATVTSPPAADRVDVFLSYNSRDRAAIERLARHLHRAGLEPWFDRWSLTPGGSWQGEIAAGLDRAAACAVFVGAHDVGDWERLELAVALMRAASDRTFRLFPVLLPGLERFDPAGLPPFLATRTWVDLRPGLESERALRELTNAVLGLPFGADVARSRPDGPCPYRGLAAFEERDARFYFGRENHVQRLLERLRQDRCVAVVGASGSGKSSLVRAGVLPRVRAGAIPGSQDWPVHVLRPGADPPAALAAALHGPDLAAVRSTADALAADERALHLAATGLLVDAPPTARVLIVVDQAEEVFTLCPDEARRRAFLANLHHATLVPGGRTAVVLTLRADFYPRLARYPTVAQYVQSRQMLLGALDDDAIRQVIEEPARVAGLRVEPGLVETIRADVVREPGSLPLLQHALLETWRLRRGDTLTLAGYRDTGGVRRGLAERAEALYGELSAQGQDVARDLMLRLTQPGEGTEDTRRRIRMSEVSAGCPPGVVEDVIGRFAAERLLTTSADESATRVEISHEALIRGWPRLRGWIDADRNGLRVHRNLTEAAREWERLGRDHFALYRGARLVEAQEWRDAAPRWLNRHERAFLDASVAADEAKRRVRLRRVRAAVVALVLVLATVATVAVVAVDRGQEAARQRDIAISRQLAANAVTALEVDPALSLALALRAYTTAPTAQAEEILRHATARSRALGTLPVGGGPVYSARLLPDGRTAATTAADGTVRLWDVPGQRVTAAIPGGTGLLTSVRARADGRQLATSGMDGSVALIDLPDGQRRVVLPADPDRFATSVDFSPDGNRLAASLSDGTVRVLDTASGRQTASLPVGPDRVFRVAFSPDGAAVVTADEDGTAQVWDVARAARTAVLQGHRGPVLAAVFHPSGRQVITSGADGTVRTWETSGAPVRTTPVDRQALFAVAVSPDGNTLATAGEDGLVRVGDADGVDLTTLPGHAGPVFDVAFDATGRRLVSAGRDGTVRLWDPGTDDAARWPVTWAAYSPDGRRVVVGGQDGHVRVLATDHLTPQLDLPVHEGRCWPVFSPDGTRIVSAGVDGTVAVRDAADGHPIATLHPHRPGVKVWSAVLDPTGSHVLSSANDGTIAVTDLAGGTTQQLPAQTGAVNIAVYAPDGRTVAAAGAAGTVQLWSPGAPPRSLAGHAGPVRALAFSRDGGLLASAGDDGTVRVWRPSDGAAVAVLPGHRGPATAVDFAADGRLASAGDDGTLRFWDVAAARLLVALRVHDGPASAADVRADGRAAVTVSEEDGVVRQTVCDVCGPIGDVLELARVRGARPLTAEEEQRYMS